MSDQEVDELIDPPPLNRGDIEKLVGTKVNNLAIYQKAFTHKSALKRYTLNESFETLEFMGDSVLGFLVTKFLFDKYEENPSLLE
jgi:ribonuclease-3